MSTVNIDSRGYGKIYQTIMRDRNLPLMAKAIYAYFCSYAGNGTTAFPKRDKIVRDLKINKDTFTKHLKTLITDGYILKERTVNGNVYTILQTVHSYAGQQNNCDDMSDMLVMENIKSKGFGTIPKLVMLDNRLTAQAKAIYAYFASFAGAGTTAFPRRSTIARELDLGEKAYNPHFKLLVDFGYITVENTRKNGKYDISIYHLADTVSLASERDGNAKSEKSHHGKNNVIKTSSRNGKIAETPISEKQPHGDSMLKTQDSINVMSEKGLSGKGMSDKAVPDNFGHANIIINNTTNISIKKEQGNNHQGIARSDEKPVPLFSLEQVKSIIRYDHWKREAEAWGNLQEKLGNFTVAGEKEHYHQKTTKLLNEVARQVADYISNASDPALIIGVVERQGFERFFDEVLNRWDTIRSPQRYVAKTLKNIFSSKFD